MQCDSVKIYLIKLDLQLRIRIAASSWKSVLYVCEQSACVIRWWCWGLGYQWTKCSNLRMSNWLNWSHIEFFLQTMNWEKKKRKSRCDELFMASLLSNSSPFRTSLLLLLASVCRIIFWCFSFERSLQTASRNNYSITYNNNRKCVLFDVPHLVFLLGGNGGWGVSCGPRGRRAASLEQSVFLLRADFSQTLFVPRAKWVFVVRLTKIHHKSEETPLFSSHSSHACCEDY